MNRNAVVFCCGEGDGGEHDLCIHTDDLFIVCVTFFKGKAEEWRIFDGDHHLVKDGEQFGLYVRVDGKIVKISEIIEDAERQYPAIIAEVEQAQADEVAYEREMSSPEATGRI